MKYLRPVCLLIPFVLWAFSGAAALEVEKILPADTGFVLVIEDVPSYLEQWETSPWAKMWNDPGFSPMTEFMKDKETGQAIWNESKPSLAEILDAVRGQAALVVPNIPLLINEDDETQGPWALIGEFSIEGSGVQEILDREMKGESKERQVQGTTVHYRMTEEEGVPKETLSWSQVGDVAVLGESSEYVAEVIGLLKGGAPRSNLAGTSEFKTMRTRNPEANAYVYVNVVELMSFVLKGMEEGMAANPQATGMGIDGSRVSEALALDAFRVFYASTKQTDNEMVFDFGLHYTPGRGLAALMANLSGPAPRPKFMAEDALMASVSRYSYSEAWDALLDILDAINPDVSGMLQMQLQQMSLSLGMDLEMDVIRNLGEDSFSIYLPAGEGAMGADQIFGISIKDPARLQEAIDALLTTMGPEADAVRSRQVGKATVYDVTGPGADMGESFSLTVYKDHLIVGIGSPDALVPVIRSMEKPGPSIWDRSDLKPLFARLPKDAGTVGYYDTGKFMQTAVGAQLDRLEKADPDKPGTEAMSEVDWERLSRYFGPMVAATVQTDQGMFGTGYLILRKP